MCVKGQIDSAKYFELGTKHDLSDTWVLVRQKKDNESLSRNAGKFDPGIRPYFCSLRMNKITQFQNSCWKFSETLPAFLNEKGYKFKQEITAGF